MTGVLSGEAIGEKVARIKDMAGFYADEDSRKSFDQDVLVYRVQYYFPVPEGTEGGLFFGNTTVFPGKVGDEYFMTKGHFHAIGNRGEYYWCIEGRGLLLKMDKDNHSWAEEMLPGSLHYMPAHVAHRSINVGKEPLVIGACWPADAGHDYGSIQEKGFGVRVKEIEGEMTMVSN